MNSLYLSAFVIGLMGSFHCIGMCGPIAMAVPVSGKGKYSRIIGSTIYNTGRTLTYIALGAIFGLFGSGFAFMGYQQQLSVIVGVLMLLFGLGLLFSKLSVVNKIFKPQMIKPLRDAFGYFAKKKSRSGLFAIGLINGLLPCGLVYMGIAVAIASASASGGALSMLFFGLGVFPVMFLIPVFSNLIQNRLKFSFNRIVPYFLIVLACLFILRGLNLGIPYVSPKAAESGQVENCH